MIALCPSKATRYSGPIENRGVHNHSAWKGVSMKQRLGWESSWSVKEGQTWTIHGEIALGRRLKRYSSS